MAVELFKGDTKRPIKFTSELDLDGQTLHASAFADDGTEYSLDATGVTSVGNPPNQETVMVIESPVDMPTGEYSIKIYTDELVVSRDFLLHFGDDPFEL